MNLGSVGWRGGGA